MLLVWRQAGCLATCREVDVVKLLLSEESTERDVLGHVYRQLVRCGR